MKLNIKEVKNGYIIENLENMNEFYVVSFDDSLEDVIKEMLNEKS